MRVDEARQDGGAREVLATAELGGSADRLRRNRRIGIVLMVVFAVLLPTVDPVSLALEVVPLLLLFELSIWLSTVMEKRWERTAFEEDNPYLPA